MVGRPADGSLGALLAIAGAPPSMVAGAWPELPGAPGGTATTWANSAAQTSHAAASWGGIPAAADLAAGV